MFTECLRFADIMQALTRRERGVEAWAALLIIDDAIRARFDFGS